MTGERVVATTMWGAAGALVLGTIGCVAGGIGDANGFFRAWLCAYLLWLGLPLGGVTLVLVHDLSGGRWMETARPPLDAAIMTMPIATLAGIPAFVGLCALYGWTHPAPSLGNLFYLNPTGFYLRFAIDVALWNLIALFALIRRPEAEPIAPGSSWLSALGLIVLAFSASFAAIDWIMSLRPDFWSSIFPMIVASSWFNTGIALVLLLIATAHPLRGDGVAHMADVAAILLATTIFWAYVEFIQFLIVWEENLKFEIPWYLVRLNGIWRPALAVAVLLGFVVPFFVLISGTGKRSRAAVASVCGAILVSRVAYVWWLVLPEFSDAGPFWLDAAAILALGGLIVLAFGWLLGRGVAFAGSAWEAEHG